MFLVPVACPPPPFRELPLPLNQGVVLHLQLSATATPVCKPSASRSVSSRGLIQAVTPAPLAAILIPEKVVAGEHMEAGSHWNSSHRYDDYDYAEVNHFLERMLKVYIKTVTCYPEKTNPEMFSRFWKQFKHSEKVQGIRGEHGTSNIAM